MKDYNGMCKNCMKLGADCAGCTNEVYSGCIYKVEGKKEDTNMMKSQFAQAVAQKVNGEVREVEKANGVKFTAILVNTGNATIRPCVYIDEFYEDEWSVNETAEKVRDLAESSAMPSRIEFMSADVFEDWERVKPMLRARLYNERTSADVKRPAGYGLDDLVIIPYIDIYGITGSDVNRSIKVTNELLKIWKVTADDVIDAAEANSADDVVIDSLVDTIAAMTGMPVDDAMREDSPLVVTNRSKTYGAYAVIAGYEALKERFPDGFTVLPSSIHEVLVVSAYDDRFNDMVNEVNDTVVDDVDVLGSKAYRVA